MGSPQTVLVSWRVWFCFLHADIEFFCYYFGCKMKCFILHLRLRFANARSSANSRSPSCVKDVHYIRLFLFVIASWWSINNRKEEEWWQQTSLFNICLNFKTQTFDQQRHPWKSCLAKWCVSGSQAFWVLHSSWASSIISCGPCCRTITCCRWNWKFYLVKLIDTTKPEAVCHCRCGVFKVPRCLNAVRAEHRPYFAER